MDKGALRAQSATELLDDIEVEVRRLGQIIRELRAEKKELLDAIEVLEVTKYEGLGHAITAEIDKARAITEVA
tara:strand:+ start:281 stop:499 length:219 start_codon:yes stop_codon:yes gene_type:complete